MSASVCVCSVSQQENSIKKLKWHTRQHKSNVGGQQKLGAAVNLMLNSEQTSIQNISLWLLTHFRGKSSGLHITRMQIQMTSMLRNWLKLHSPIFWHLDLYSLLKELLEKLKKAVLEDGLSSVSWKGKSQGCEYFTISISYCTSNSWHWHRSILLWAAAGTHAFTAIIFPFTFSGNKFLWKPISE